MSLSDGPTFEAATKRLGEIVGQLEAGDLPLEKALQVFEEGVRLAHSAQGQLDQAEKRVQELVGFGADGSALLEERNVHEQGAALKDRG